MVYLIVAGFTILTAFQITLFHELASMNHTLLQLQNHVFFADTPEYNEEIADEPAETPYEERILSDSEVRALEREAEFDLRIARMKEELALKVADKPVNPTVAETYHPLVHNLPHNIITDLYDSLPDVEISQ